MTPTAWIITFSEKHKRAEVPWPRPLCLVRWFATRAGDRVLAKEFDVSVVGARYAGLVSGACRARVGYQATLIDKSVERIKLAERGDKRRARQWTESTAR